MAVALIVAAGRGERLGSGRPKALATLGGRPMLEWSVRALRAVPAVEAIVVALPAGTAFSPSPGAPSARERLVTVSGGRTRSESVRAALAAAPPGDPVIVHDAARPLATAELFERALTEMRLGDADAVIAAVPVSDTIKEVDEDGRRVARTLERKRLWAAQTPQVFAREALERVLADASPELLASATDDAWLIERAGGTVRIMDSDPANIKVTTPDDLRVAELLLSERQR
ncbi:MAG: 2-C-methyl-D-erythritol 4-phosphate cytidylyltransferase [Solirubrobacterales bacterium]|nr:2-C-methyl-D-erythritol 4-phosphate cytidylyltransferase [Solirubrobacterales bacterium]